PAFLTMSSMRAAETPSRRNTARADSRTRRRVSTRWRSRSVRAPSGSVGFSFSTAAIVLTPRPPASVSLAYVTDICQRDLLQTRTVFRTRFTFALVSLAFLGAAEEARAAGLYFSDRGVRPMGRGGAFVAGADDLGAVWYNPAGLADAGTSVLVDFSWLRFDVDYTRQLLVQDSGGTYQTFSSPEVHGSTPVLPLPTIGGSYNFGSEKRF